MSDHPYSLLVVEDSEMLLDTLTAYLDQQGFRVIPARNGSEALLALDDEPIDLVILDVRMPGLSGMEVLKTLRESYDADRLPVIMATALDESEDMVEAFELGASDYVTKPLDLPVILARIQARLRSKVPAAQRAQQAHEPVDFQFAPGVVLEGKYRLDSKIGEGQFGVVYRGTHLELKRSVAVKMLSTGSSDDEDLKARFRQEGMSTCQIQHPNAVSVLDFSFTPGGVPYMVMELLEGQSLDEELLIEGRLLPERCAEILEPVCAVLAEAHGLGIIHRDIKPQEHLSPPRPAGEEVVKVLDFGLAKLVGAEVLERRLTLEGVGPGTPLYMAPERFNEQPYDGGTDIYSLGVTLYEMLIGQPPFLSLDGNPFKVAMMHIYDRPPSICELNPKVPSALEAVIHQALEKESARRPSALDLWRSFDEALQAAAKAQKAAKTQGAAKATGSGKDQGLTFDTQKIPDLGGSFPQLV